MNLHHEISVRERAPMGGRHLSKALFLKVLHCVLSWPRSSFAFCDRLNIWHGSCCKFAQPNDLKFTNGSPWGSIDHPQLVDGFYDRTLNRGRSP